jgi:hypothetical protein
MRLRSFTGFQGLITCPTSSPGRRLGCAPTGATLPRSTFRSGSGPRPTRPRGARRPGHGARGPVGADRSRGIRAVPATTTTARCSPRDATTGWSDCGIRRPARCYRRWQGTRTGCTRSTSQAAACWPADHGTRPSECETSPQGRRGTCSISTGAGCGRWLSVRVPWWPPLATISRSGSGTRKAPGRARPASGGRISRRAAVIRGTPVARRM